MYIPQKHRLDADYFQRVTPRTVVIADTQRILRLEVSAICKQSGVLWDKSDEIVLQSMGQKFRISDDLQLSSCDEGRTLEFSEVPSGKCVWKGVPDRHFRDLAFSPAGDRVAMLSRDGIRILHLNGGHMQDLPRRPGPRWSRPRIAWVDEDRLVYGIEGERTCILNLTTGRDSVLEGGFLNAAGGSWIVQYEGPWRRNNSIWSNPSRMWLAEVGGERRIELEFTEHEKIMLYHLCNDIFYLPEKGSVLFLDRHVHPWVGNSGSWLVFMELATGDRAYIRCPPRVQQLLAVLPQGRRAGD